MTRKLDATEATLGAAVSLLIAVAANHTVLPWWGFHPSLSQSFQMGLFFFALSICMRYVFRRLFRRVDRGWLPLPAEVDTAKAPFDGKRYLIWIDWDDDGDDNAHVAEFDGLHWTPVDNCWVNPAIVTHYQIVEGPT